MVFLNAMNFTLAYPTRISNSEPLNDFKGSFLKEDLLLSNAMATPPPLVFLSLLRKEILSLCSKIFNSWDIFLFPLLNHVSVSKATVELCILKFVLNDCIFGTKHRQFISRELKDTSIAI